MCSVVPTDFTEVKIGEYTKMLKKDKAVEFPTEFNSKNDGKKLFNKIQRITEVSFTSVQHDFFL
jgi:hypothetical protein